MNREFRDTLDRVLGRKKRKRSGIYQSVKDGDLANPIQLDEFLEGVGGVLRLPPKEAVPAPKATPREFRIALPAGWLRLALPVLGAITLALLVIPGSEKPPEGSVLPPQLIGLWTTGDPRYVNRTFEITPGFVVFKNGERPDDQTVHEISGVRTEERADTSVVTLAYLDAGATYQLALKYLPRPTPSITFVNQEELVWRRAVVTPAGSR